MPEVTDIVASGLTQNEVLFYASSAEKGSEHPLGESIIKKAKEGGIESAQAEQFSAVPGHGIKATINGKQVMLGNEKLMKDEGIDTEVRNSRSGFFRTGKTLMFVSVDKKLPVL
jgi:Cu+-exporting ATPase